jgi:hypothetical protein
LKIDINNPATKTATKIVPFDLQKLQSVKADDQSVQVGLYINEEFTPLKSFQVFTINDTQIIVGEIVGGLYSWDDNGRFLGNVEGFIKATGASKENNLVLQVTEQESTQLSATLHLENEDDIALITALIGTVSLGKLGAESTSSIYGRLHNVVFKDLGSYLYQKYRCIDEKQRAWLKDIYGRTL